MSSDIPFNRSSSSDYITREYQGLDEYGSEYGTEWEDEEDVDDLDIPYEQED
jgi:hypothetical protein